MQELAKLKCAFFKTKFMCSALIQLGKQDGTANLEMLACLHSLVYLHKWQWLCTEEKTHLKSMSLYRDSTEIGAAVFALRISLVRLTCFFNFAIALGD
jgi:hypothetical protein